MVELLEALDVGTDPTDTNFSVGLHPDLSDFASPFYDCPIKTNLCGKCVVSLQYFISLFHTRILVVWSSTWTKLASRQHLQGFFSGRRMNDLWCNE